MRKSLAIAIAAVVLAGSTITARALASEPSGGHPSPHSGFTVVEHAVTDTVADTGPAGDSLGDVLAFANPVFDATNTHRVGTDNGSCVRTRVGASYECSWTTTLRGGSLVVEGPFFDAADSVLAVTGGTGAYRGSAGQMKLHARNAKGSAFDFVFTLQRD